jgi:hypothetical protein
MPHTRDDYNNAALDRLRKPPKGALYKGLPKSQWKGIADQAAEAVAAHPQALSRPWTTVPQTLRVLTDVTGAAPVLGDPLPAIVAALALDVARVFHLPPVAPDAVYDDAHSKANQVGQSLWSQGQILGDQGRPDADTLPLSLSFAVMLAAAVVRNHHASAAWDPASETRTLARDVGLREDDIDGPVVAAATGIVMGVLDKLREEAEKQRADAEREGAQKAEKEEMITRLLSAGSLSLASGLAPNDPRVVAAVEADQAERTAAMWSSNVDAARPSDRDDDEAVAQPDAPMVAQVFAEAKLIVGTVAQPWLAGQGLGDHLDAAANIDRFALAHVLIGTPGGNPNCRPGSELDLVRGTKEHLMLQVFDCAGESVDAVITSVKMEQTALAGSRPVAPWADVRTIGEDAVQGFLMNPAALRLARGAVPARPASMIIVAGVEDYLAQSVLQAHDAVCRASVRGIGADEIMRPVIGALPGSVDDPRPLQALVSKVSTVYIRGRGDEAGREFEGRLANLLAGHVRVRVLLHHDDEPVGEIEKLRGAVLPAHPALGTHLHPSRQTEDGQTNLRAAIHEGLARADGVVRRLPWPWPAAQRDLHGLDRDLTLLAGPTGLRKTDMAAEVALHGLGCKGRVLFVSTEMSSAQVHNRFIAKLVRVGWDRLDKGVLSSDERTRLVGVESDGGLVGLTIWASERGRRRSVADLVAEIEVWVEDTLDQVDMNGLPPLIVIDYLQNLDGGDSGDDLSLMAKELEESSRTFGYAVLGISRVSKQWSDGLMMEAASKRPAADFKETPFGTVNLAYTATTTLVVGSPRHNAAGNLTEVRVGIAKQRAGRTSPAGGWIRLLVDEVGLHEPTQGPSV